jgi:putative oxidoreductase
MAITRRLARPLLAAVFITGGIDTLRHPGPRVDRAEPVAPPVGQALGLTQDTEQLVKINAVAQIAGGVLLAIGRLPRLAATVLAGSLVPTTFAGHRFWEETDPQAKAQQQIHFFKNMGLLGGLILAAVDTEGAPSVAWRAKRAAGRAKRAVGEAVSDTFEALPLVG